MIEQYLKNMRKKQHLTIDMLAEGIVSPATLSRFEQGKGDIGVNKFFQLINRLGLTLENVALEFDNGVVARHAIPASIRHIISA